MSTKYLTYNKDIDYINAFNKLASPYNHNNYAYIDEKFPSKCQIYEFHPNKFIKKGGKTKKRKNLKNKSKKRRGGSQCNDQELEKYKIKDENLTLEHYIEAFGKENGEYFFNQNPKPPYSLYKVPIEGELENRIKCADSNLKDSKLFNYLFINDEECKRYGSIYCEAQFANNRYQKLLNLSNRWSKSYKPTIEECVVKNKRQSPRSVTEGVPEEKEKENVFNNFYNLQLGGRKKNKKRRRRTKKRKS